MINNSNKVTLSDANTQVTNTWGHIVSKRHINANDDKVLEVSFSLQTKYTAYV